MITIRPVTIADVDAVRSLADARCSPPIGSESGAMNTDYAAAVHAGRLRIAADGERVVGFVVIVQEGTDLIVENIAVDPQRQGCEVGDQLLLDVEAYAVSLGCTEVRLLADEVTTENLAYCLQHGYVETHRATDRDRPGVYFSKRV